MRLAALFLFVLTSSSAPVAQQRFVEACMKAGTGADPADAQAICGCAATAALNQGISGASLDGMMDYVDAQGDLALETAPAPVQALAEVVGQGLFGCAMERIEDALATMEMAPQSPEETGSAGSVAARPKAAPALPRVTPPRTSAQRRASQAGRGAAVRIRG